MSCQKVVTYAGGYVLFRPSGFTVDVQPELATTFTSEAEAWLKIKDSGLPFHHCEVKDLE